MGSRADSRHPLKPLIANSYHVISTTIMVVVNTSSASPSLVHPFTVREMWIRVQNPWRECGHDPTSTGFCGIHGASQKVGMITYHFH
jgi:hypothetical protein